MVWQVSSMHQIRSGILLLPCSRWKGSGWLQTWFGLFFIWMVINRRDSGPASKFQSPQLDTRPLHSGHAQQCVQPQNSFTTVLWTRLREKRQICTSHHHFKGSIASHQIHRHCVLSFYHGPCICKSFPQAYDLLWILVFCFLLFHRMYASALVYLRTCSHNTGLTTEAISITVSWNMDSTVWI